MSSSAAGGSGSAVNISRFFAPKRAPLVEAASEDTFSIARGVSHHESSEAGAERPSGVPVVAEDADGWQRPLGLTADAAIEIDDDEDDVALKDVIVAISQKVEENLASVEAHGGDSIDGEDKSKSKSWQDDTIADDNPLLGSEEAISEVPKPEKCAETSSITDNNPFAAFAYGTSSSSASIAANDGAHNNRRLKRPLAKTGNRSDKKGPEKKRRSATKNKSDDYVPIQQLPVEEQEKIRKKWQSLGDPNAPLEIRRFQVLVAARLHAQSKEPIVKKAMENLRKHFAEADDGGDSNTSSFCAETLSRADPKEVASLIPSVLFANTKSEHIVKAAKEVCSRFGGIVPQSRHGLMELTGIGPKLADILSFVNARKAYQNSEVSVTQLTR
eukprot:CAMPEP_0178474434 /NCGR_PEP_ID=MMETSP0696-20121128/2598_1 /TAXON_ID=265572 /ORGANISM="Extubocellulus spinifer, Strain CCMP396" /LENGTH=385 /DNA_ID=CAMNT_0020101683 /DNA_START=108 /DNA_END=1265 /DNA_ORIENTATION=-